MTDSESSTGHTLERGVDEAPLEECFPLMLGLASSAAGSSAPVPSYPHTSPLVEAVAAARGRSCYS